MPFNVTSIKDKAVSAKNTAVTKTTDFRDRHSSTPMAQTKFTEDGYGIDKRKSPPPPPPMRNHSSRPSITSSQRPSDDGPTSISRSGPPPPVLKGSKPTMGPHASDSPAEVEQEQGRKASVMERAKAFRSSSSIPLVKSPAPMSPPIKSFPPVPPIRKAAEPPSIKQEPDADKIDWANLSMEDKQEFFGWLDEFFERFLEKSNRPTVEMEEYDEKVAVVEEHPPAPPVSKSTIQTQVPNKPPPVIKSWSKPKLETIQSSTELQMSYPPPTTHGSQALDLAHYMHPSTAWSDTWYAQQGATPPPLQQSIQRLCKGMYMTLGDTRTISHVALFSDLSTAWTSISFSVLHPSSIYSREGLYLPPAEPADRETLVQASETYGETIASFAEGFLGSGTFCARGECWDLASEALKYFSAFDDVDKPITSINRTHGHLIFCGRATGKGMQQGKWRGGDDRVRRGDIVEWRTVRINFVGGPKGGYALLGDPEHTAVITRDSVPQVAGGVRDGMSVEPSALGGLEVVEQSTNLPPEPRKNEYDMEAFEQGEVWIYRPIAMKVHLGYEKLDCSPPPNALRL